MPHSTWISGYGFVYSGDDRYYNNIYVSPNGKAKEDAPINTNTKPLDKFSAEFKDKFSGTKAMDQFTDSLEEYFKCINEKDFESIDLEKFDQTPYPVYIDGNAYYNGSQAYARENHNYIDENFNPNIKIIEEGNDVYLEIELDEKVFDIDTKTLCTKCLGKTILVDAIFDGPNGENLIFSKDILGNKRNDKPLVGPLENLKAGINKIKLNI
ncbi:hypothetical protein AN641_07865 [Candidatus Epulonipiscioides gigas]|nr:hypothetical protein AN641_07865 [Epulopiscium sp. SCG-C07WGA-EpuloA2]